MEAGEILMRRGLLNRGQLEQTKSMANGHGDGTKLIESAIQLGFVSEEQALKAVGEEVGIDFIDLQEADVDLTWAGLHLVVYQFGVILLEHAINRHLPDPLRSEPGLERWRRAITALYRHGLFRAEAS